MPSAERRLKHLLSNDAAPGMALIAAAVIALIVVNSPLRPLHDAWLNTTLAVQIGAFEINKPKLLWINDGLMAIFFFYVGLEIKRELLTGQLSSARQAALPAIAAIGGVILPAAIYAGLNWNDPAAIQGWAIPAATDIAFALGILALLGTRAPTSLKIFLLAVAIIDDLMAIIIIALFYSGELSTTALGVGAAGIGLLVVFNRMKITGFAPYILVGLVIWAAVLKSGVHATLAGVMIALTIPMSDPKNADRSPVVIAEHALKPWVLFLVMPVFALANAGVPLSGLSVADLLAPLPLGIALGLFVGKQLGVFSFAWLAIKSGLATRPQGLSWTHIYGASLLAGVGFTMSLFIGGLAFADPEQQNAVRLGVMVGSVTSAVLGYIVLRYFARPASHTDDATGAVITPAE